ncbi:hypothetical protein HY68_38955, partial [Streptomyces sp. AcH 505]|uniref:porin n=1 Tax=Streptomyces sp. AcH 505 TaxID=352211 RepID=UPI000591A992
CSLYGAGFYYIPGTDTCIRISGAIRVGTTFNGLAWGVPYYRGGSGGANSYNRTYFTTRSRFVMNFDTRTATDYGVVRTYASSSLDFTQGYENIAGGEIANDFLFIQFAGFTFGKAVSQFDPQWALYRPFISSTGFFAGSFDATGIPQLAYTAEFGNGISASVALEDAYPYRTSGVANMSLSGTSALIGPLDSATLGYGTTPNNFPANAQAGDHVPDIVGNLRLDQNWGSLHVGAAAHEVHGTYYTPSNSASGHPDATWGYAVVGAFELKNLPTGVGDSLKVEAAFANGAAKYVFGGSWDTAGAGRLAKVGGGGMAFGYVLDGIYGNGTSITKSNSWEVDAFYEHYWAPTWRTSLFGSYSHVDYGSGGDALLLAAANAGRLSTGATNATGSFEFAVLMLGTRTAWEPVKNLTLAAEFDYTRLYQHLNGTFTTSTALYGMPAGTVFQLKDQGIYSGHVQILRSF